MFSALPKNLRNVISGCGEVRQKGPGILAIEPL
jgi:hypothetical protein